MWGTPVAYNTNQTPLPALLLWQNLTSNDILWVYGLWTPCSVLRQGTCSPGSPLTSKPKLCLVNKRDVAALSCPQVPLNVPVKANQNTLKKLNVWFIIFKMLFVYRV